MNNKFETLKAITRALNAADPSNGFLTVPAGDNYRIEINGNAECYIWFRADKNRLEISGNFHLVAARGHAEWFGDNRHRGAAEEGKPEYTAISVSAEKSPEAIAKDILRRFLPGYLVAFKRCSDVRDNHLKFRKDCVSTAKALTEAAGEVFTDDLRQRISGGGQEVSLYVNRHADASLRLGVRVSGDTAEIGVGYLPVDKCVKLVEFLKTLAAE